MSFLRRLCFNKNWKNRLFLKQKILGKLSEHTVSSSRVVSLVSFGILCFVLKWKIAKSNQVIQMSRFLMLFLLSTVALDGCASERQKENYKADDAQLHYKKPLPYKPLFIQLHPANISSIPFGEYSNCWGVQCEGIQGFPQNITIKSGWTQIDKGGCGRSSCGPASPKLLRLDTNRILFSAWEGTSDSYKQKTPRSLLIAYCPIKEMDATVARVTKTLPGRRRGHSIIIDCDFVLGPVVRHGQSW